jgi:hypothetical protein
MIGTSEITRKPKMKRDRRVIQQNAYPLATASDGIVRT